MLWSRLRHPHLFRRCLVARFEPVSGAGSGPQPPICSASWWGRPTRRVNRGVCASILGVAHLGGGHGCTPIPDAPSWPSVAGLSLGPFGSRSCPTSRRSSLPSPGWWKLANPTVCVGRTV
jgi:hypothetical protein